MLWRCPTVLLLLWCGIWIEHADSAITAWTIDGDTHNGVDVAVVKDVPEDQAAGVVFTITATGTGTVTYDIASQPEDGQFTIGSGGLSLDGGKLLDRELYSSREVIVTATDDSTTGTATITINVTDVNDNAPQFQKTAEYVVIENGKGQNTTVLKVNATDNDVTNNVITYSIDSGNTNTDFAIDGQSGQITVAKTLNMTATPGYGLVVHAVDSPATGKMTGTVTVNVIVWTFDNNNIGGGGAGNAADAVDRSFGVLLWLPLVLFTKLF